LGLVQQVLVMVVVQEVEYFVELVVVLIVGVVLVAEAV
jgi:hypothetical protein